MKTQTFDIIAATAFGLEAVTARELEDLGFTPRILSTGRVLFQGTLADIALANLWLRSADRVLIRVAQFPCKDFDTLFDTVKLLPWEDWIGPQDAFPVNGRSVKSQLSSVPACQRTVKKAMVQRLQRAHGSQMLPETGARIITEIALLNDEATITIDTSGDGLHKRGYRPLVGEAALKETLAASLVLLSVWRRERPLVDPFCGSGTIAIEAAMFGMNIAPGLRRSFDAQHWHAFGSTLWEEARAQAAAAPRHTLGYAIHAADIDERALWIGRQAAKLAGVDREIHFQRRDFSQLSSKIEYGCIITNPPYGVRLGESEEIEHLYRTLPLVLRRLPTWSFHVLTARQDLEELVGQHATRRRKLFNSQIECTYFTFLGPKPPSPDRAGVQATGQTDETESAAPHGTNAGVDDELVPTGAEVGPEVTSELQAQREHPTNPVEEANVTDGSPKNPRGNGQPDASPDADSLPDPVSSVDDVITDDTTSPDSTFAGAGGASNEAGQSPKHSGNRQHIQAGPAFGGLRERDQRELSDFRACLSKNVRHLRKYPSRGITCYRIYDRDQVDVPLIIDIYEGRVHIAEYEREHSRTFAQQADWMDAVRGIVSEETGTNPEHIYIKEKHRQRGLTQHEKVADVRDAQIVHEDGLSFEVNLSDYIDTGLFLDHRQTRHMVREQATGKRFLNLFCYTGSFTVYAAAGGATKTTSVDLSNTYLDWAKRNLSINRLMNASHTFVRSDVLDFLSTHPQGPHFDLAVVDPPTFSNSKNTQEDWEVAIGHKELFTRLAPLLAPGAVVYFSTNYRRFKLDEALLASLGMRFTEISSRTVPPDFRNKRIHRCWRLVLDAQPNAQGQG